MFPDCVFPVIVFRNVDDSMGLSELFLSTCNELEIPTLAVPIQFKLGYSMFEHVS